MAVGTQLPPRLQGPVRVAKKVVERPVGALDDLGAQLSFYARSIGWTYRVLIRYKKEVLRLLAEVSLGSGALALVGGTVGVIAALVASYKALNAKGGPKGVGDAVNQSVVISFMLLFLTNFIITAIYFQVVPQKGG